MTPGSRLGFDEPHDSSSNTSVQHQTSSLCLLSCGKVLGGVGGKVVVQDPSPECQDGPYVCLSYVGLALGP
jgi:hypothetical protein